VRVRKLLPWASVGLAAFAVMLAMALSATAAPSKSGATTVRAAVVTDIGGLNDKGFNHLSYVGLQRAQKQLSVSGRAYITSSASSTSTRLGFEPS